MSCFRRFLKTTWRTSSRRPFTRPQPTASCTRVVPEEESLERGRAGVSGFGEFVDACVGRLIKSLDDGPMADHTWVVLLSDHGFFLGEKERWAKQALWERATRVPLIIVPPKSLPESSVRDSTCLAPVELLSLYPTLLDFCQLKHPPHLEGRSIMPLVQSPPDRGLIPPSRPSVKETTPFAANVGGTHAMRISLRSFTTI